MAVGINTVDLYDTTTLARIRSLDLKPKGVYLAVAFDRAGKRLAMATVGAFIYNLCADFIGGVEVTLADLD